MSTKQTKSLKIKNNVSKMNLISYLLVIRTNSVEDKDIKCQVSETLANSLKVFHSSFVNFVKNYHNYLLDDIYLKENRVYQLSACIYFIAEMICNNKRFQLDIVIESLMKLILYSFGNIDYIDIPIELLNDLYHYSNNYIHFFDSFNDNNFDNIIVDFAVVNYSKQFRQSVSVAKIKYLFDNIVSIYYGNYLLKSYDHGIFDLSIYKANDNDKTSYSEVVSLDLNYNHDKSINIINNMSIIASHLCSLDNIEFEFERIFFYWDYIKRQLFPDKKGVSK